jgi:uncharacterized repeat protein (TIGR03803 family)
MGQEVTTIATFNGVNGSSPVFGPVQGVDGNFYGTTYAAGANNRGSVYQVTAESQLTTVYSFCAQAGCTDGEYVYGGLVLGADGAFYGITVGGGLPTNPDGTAFKITSKGTLTTLYSFCAKQNCTDGAFPATPLALGSNATYYGTTSGGGANNLGTVFKVSSKGQLATVYNFCPQAGCADGQGPFGPGLFAGTDGNFYGIAAGGVNGHGVAFRLTPAGKESVLYSFCSRSNCVDGSTPQALVQVGANFYGLTMSGGTGVGCGVGCGTVFKLTSAGKLATLYNFCPQTNCVDGADPVSLTLATDGNLYGTTSQGGTANGGVLFSISPAGKFTTLYSFCSETNCPDGAFPGALTQATTGVFWGTTQAGGTNFSTCSGGCGTVFTLNMGLAPFIEAVPASGKVGSTVLILGNSLTGSTSVTFNGKAAAFKVVSSTEITVTVPAGATTGSVKVVTPHRTLTSNAAYRVTP